MWLGSPSLIPLLDRDYERKEFLITLNRESVVSVQHVPTAIHTHVVLLAYSHTPGGGLKWSCVETDQPVLESFAAISPEH